jgi:hypothetical protein
MVAKVQANAKSALPAHGAETYLSSCRARFRLVNPSRCVRPYDLGLTCSVASAWNWNPCRARGASSRVGLRRRRCCRRLPRSCGSWYARPRGRRVLVRSSKARESHSAGIWIVFAVEMGGWRGGSCCRMAEVSTIQIKGQPLTSAPTRPPAAPNPGLDGQSSVSVALRRACGSSRLSCTVVECSVFVFWANEGCWREGRSATRRDEMGPLVTCDVQGKRGLRRKESH